MEMYLASVSSLETDLKAESGGLMKAYLAESGGLMKAYLAESGGLIFNDANIYEVGNVLCARLLKYID